MLDDIKRRLQELFAHEPEIGFDIKELHRELRADLEAHIAEKEKELEDARNCMSDLEYAEAVMDSFQGGPGEDTGTEE